MERFDELFPKIELVEDTFNLELIGYLILRIGLNTHDAILVTTAIENKATHFATRDDRLIESLKNKEFKNKFKLKAEKPQTILSYLNNKI